MFYVKEAAYRGQYFLLSLIVTIAICYFNRNILLFLLTESVLSSHEKGNLLNVDHFIYTHPLELFTVQIFLMVYFSILFTFPMLFWNVADFLKSCFTLLEHKNFCKIIIFLFLFFIIFNIIFCFYFFPSIWFFFQNFNMCLDSDQNFSFFLELRVYEYFSFLTHFIYLTNTSFGVLVVCVFLFTFPDFKNLIYWKKLFIFLNMVFATLLSPPDVSTQIFIFVFLSILLESLILICLFYSKFEKYSSFNKASY